MQSTNRHRRLQTRWIATTAAVLGGGLLLYLCSLIAVHFLVNLWWFDSVGYGFYFWQRLLYKYAVFGSVAIVFFLIFFLNFGFASRYLGKSRSTSGGSPQKQLRKLRIGSRLVYIPLSVVLATVLALPLFRHWHEFLFYIFGPQSGVSDPVFGKDVSYYLFSLPIYLLIQQRLFMSFLVLLLGLGVLYSLEYHYALTAQKSLPHQIVRHLGVLMAVLVLISLWGTSLELHSLVYTKAHEPLFYGPGYVQMRFVAPLMWAQMLFLAATAVALGIALKRRKGFVIPGILCACFLLALGLRYMPSLQDQIETYIVKPNELEMERPFIQMNIKGTLNAYGLTNVETRNFTRNTATHVEPLHVPHLQRVLRNVPLWDRSELNQVYRQLEELRTYYHFPEITVGRYLVKGQYQQVFLAARELDYNRLPLSAKNWINEHLTYTHGYGLVMTPASQEGGEPMVWFVRGIPPTSAYDMTVKRAGIYFGMGSFNNYVIAPNATGELDYPLSTGNVTSHYTGRGGVAVSSLFRRTIFAFYFKDYNILISQRLVDQSRILFVRNIVARIRKLAPYLLLDRTAYMAMTPEGLYWIQDAYTTSETYSDSQPVNFEGQHFNYIRNSVKIVVDAYNGTVNFYIAAPKDPIIRAYSRIYPGLFKDLSQMPADLRAHIRYPKDFFDVQMQIYAKYHQTNPQTFYEQEDIWDFAKTIEGSGSVSKMIHPYYLSLDLIKPENVEFLLLEPMSPQHRDNLRAMVVAGCDGNDYGKLVAYSFPKGQLVYSPVQIDALINADPEIVRQFNLWDLSGSEVQRGTMIILPAGNNIYYVQPVFLTARAGQHEIPQLQRTVMSEGQVAVMDPTIEASYQHLNSRLTKLEQEVSARFSSSYPKTAETNLPY